MKVHLTTNFPTHFFVTGDRERFTQAKGRFETLTDTYPQFIDLMPLILFEVCFFFVQFFIMLLGFLYCSMYSPPPPHLVPAFSHMTCSSVHVMASVGNVVVVYAIH